MLDANLDEPVEHAIVKEYSVGHLYVVECSCGRHFNSGTARHKPWARAKGKWSFHVNTHID